MKTTATVRNGRKFHVVVIVEEFRRSNYSKWEHFDKLIRCSVGQSVRSSTFYALDLSWTGWDYWSLGDDDDDADNDDKRNVNLIIRHAWICVNARPEARTTSQAGGRRAGKQRGCRRALVIRPRQNIWNTVAMTILILYRMHTKELAASIISSSELWLPSGDECNDF